MIVEELFMAQNEFKFEYANKNKSKKSIRQNLKDVKNVLLELSNNGNIITDEIQKVIDSDLALNLEKYNTGDELDLPDYRNNMRQILDDPESNVKFLINTSFLLPNDIFYCEEEEIPYKNLKLIGEYWYQDKYSKETEVAHIYQNNLTYELYDIYGEFDGYNNLYYLSTSPTSYAKLIAWVGSEDFEVNVDLPSEKRKFDILERRKSIMAIID